MKNTNPDNAEGCGGLKQLVTVKVTCPVFEPEEKPPLIVKALAVLSKEQVKLVAMFALVPTHAGVVVLIICLMSVETDAPIYSFQDGNVMYMTLL